MKKRLLSILLVLAVILTLGITVNAADEQWYSSGNGTKGNPYVISNYDGLNAFADEVNQGNSMENKFIQLATDFGKGSGNRESLIKPIGDNSVTNAQFKGCFDGNGQNIVIAIGTEASPYNGQYAGLFGYNAGTVENVSTSGKIYASYTNETVNAGGVAGVNDGTIVNCYSTCDVKALGNAGNYAGGIAGSNGSSKTIVNCFAVGTVSAINGTTNKTGGICASNDGDIINCYCIGDGYDGTRTEEQMKAAPGEEGAMIDLLRSFSLNGYHPWTISDGQYPKFKEMDISWYNTTDTEFVLKDVAQLEGLAYLTQHVDQFEGKTIKLDKNFNCNNSDCLTTPIGTGEQGFKGTFDGNDKEVKVEMYLKNNLSDQSINVGLFGKVENGTVKNVNSSGDIQSKLFIESTYQQPIDSSIGGIAGMIDKSTITNCHTKNQITTGAGSDSINIGGIVGLASNSNDITNCDANVDIEGLDAYYVGGIVGHIVYSDENETVQILNCHVESEITGYQSIGGIVGEVQTLVEEDYCGSLNVIISDCTFSGNIVGQESNVGGILGGVYDCYSIDSVTINNCYTTGLITSSSFAGGIVGFSNDACSVTHCHSQAEVQAMQQAGGIVGLNQGQINDCYATGNITAINTGGQDTAKFFGGIAAYNYGLIINCFSTGKIIDECDVYDTADKSYYGGIVGKNDGNVKNCYTWSDIHISGTFNIVEMVGGIVGENNGNIENCYTAGNMTIPDESENIGGIAGQNGNVNNNDASLTNCYFKTGTAENNPFGSNKGQITNCYDLSEAQMKAKPGTTGTDWKEIVIGENDPVKITLVDALNQYRNAYLTEEGFNWKVDDAYPVFGTNAKEEEKEEKKEVVHTGLSNTGNQTIEIVYVCGFLAIAFAGIFIWKKKYNGPKN